MKGRALLSWNLRRLRTERGLSQGRLATKLKMDRAYLSEIENKHRKPTVDLLDKLAEAQRAVPRTFPAARTGCRTAESVAEWASAREDLIACGVWKAPVYVVFTGDQSPFAI